MGQNLAIGVSAVTVIAQHCSAKILEDSATIFAGEIFYWRF